MAVSYDEAARYLAEKYNPPATHFALPSRSRRGRVYPMVLTPEGVAIHDGEECEGGRFNGPFGCWHSRQFTKENVMTQALARVESVLTRAPIAFNEEQMKVITQTICKGATPAELQLFVATCTRTGLDPFMRQIYAVKRWDSRERKEVMAIQIGIDGMRLIAERTGKYAGQDPIEWLDSDGQWSEVWTGKGEFPIAARCSVYRKDWPNAKATGVCRWDSYAQTYTKDGNTFLSPTWDKMPDVMLGKCAESLALRKAFPAEMSALAALAGETYDPAADYEQAETQPEYTPPADAIEGTFEDVTKHGETQEAAASATATEGSPVKEAPPGPASNAADTPPASPPEPPAPKAEKAAPAPSKAKTPPGTEEGAISSFWAAVRLAKLDVGDVKRLSQERFEGREPMHLTPEERASFLNDLTSPKEPQTPAAVLPQDHEKATGHNEPVFTPEGDFICGDCKAPLLDAVPA